MPAGETKVNMDESEKILADEGESRTITAVLLGFFFFPFFFPLTRIKGLMFLICSLLFEAIMSRQKRYSS